jgi:hypothetical protein
MAPAWMPMLNRSERWPSQRSAISRWPVLEIGRNSVMPSMTPSNSAWIRSDTGRAEWLRRMRKDTRSRCRSMPGHGRGGMHAEMSKRCKSRPIRTNLVLFVEGNALFFIEINGLFFWWLARDLL